MTQAQTQTRLRVADLAEQLDVTERDVIDAAHDAGCEEFEQDGLELEYDDFDRWTPLRGQRGYSDRHGFAIDVDDVEVLLDDRTAERFAYMTGADLW